MCDGARLSRARLGAAVEDQGEEEEIQSCCCRQELNEGCCWARRRWLFDAGRECWVRGVALALDNKQMTCTEPQYPPTDRTLEQLCINVVCAAAAMELLLLLRHHTTCERCLSTPSSLRDVKCIWLYTPAHRGRQEAQPTAQVKSPVASGAQQRAIFWQTPKKR